MKVGTKLGGPLEWLLLRLNVIPAPLVDSFSAMMKAKAILAANELGLFNALEAGPLAIAELSHRLGATGKGVERLVDALAASGYLVVRGKRCRLSRVSRKWLIRSSPTYIGHMLQHVNDLWAVWRNLEEAVITGAPPADDYQDWLRSEEYRWMLRRHIVGLRDTARLSAPELLRAVRLPGAKSADATKEAPGADSELRLLDIGGGHGGYSIAFCDKYPRLTATVFDLEATSEIGREIVEREGMSNRVRFQTGDFLSDDFGSGYAAALYFNILHNYSEADNRRVLAKAYRALRPGGVIVAWDIFKAEGGPTALLPALMALHMLVASGGTSYGLEEVDGWLREIGFSSIRHKEMSTLPGFTLVIARKPRRAIVDAPV
jgi:ubiquinone/menaquinone biosynthesis C-methylase UbiE